MKHYTSSTKALRRFWNHATYDACFFLIVWEPLTRTVVVTPE